jgi:hypothetical protein
VPLQNNFDFGAGPNGDGFQYKLNLQPVVSFCISRQWTVPLVFLVAQLVNIGQTPVQFQLAGRYYAEKPAGGPDWGLRFAMVLLFPK